jgi:hypothetical protein
MSEGTNKSQVIETLRTEAASEHGARVGMMVPDGSVPGYKEPESLPPGEKNAWTAIDSTYKRLMTLLEQDGVGVNSGNETFHIRGEVGDEVERVVSDLIDLGATINVQRKDFRADVVPPDGDWNGEIPEEVTDIYLDQRVCSPGGRFGTPSVDRYSSEYGIRPSMVGGLGRGTTFNKPGDGWPSKFLEKLREYHEDGWRITFSHRPPRD